MTGLTRNRGIIPARAGFTIWGATFPPLIWDHPRSRGVYPFRMAFRISGLGSSPLARGLLPREIYDFVDNRIIPARAGFTSRRWTRSWRRRDHPRSRGVYTTCSDLVHYRWGSSPLARGLRAARRPGRAGAGIIPARAGFTPREVLRDFRPGDHPRSRGVYRLVRRRAHRRRGSSPLARGLPLRILGIPTNPYSTRPRLPSLPT